MKNLSLPIGPFQHLSGQGRQESLHRTIAQAPDADEIWVFAYGSLIWRPCFRPAAQQQGVLGGYQRRFSIFTVEARGSPERPGLGLALEPGGGRCEGLLQKVPQPDRDGALSKLWEREMLTGIYQPRWLAVESRAGALTALVFVVDRGHPQYAGALSQEDQARLIKNASGTLGSCRDYLRQTVAALGAAGIRDVQLSALLDKVEQI